MKMDRLIIHNPNDLALVPVSELVPLQGDFKFLTASNFEKLSKSIKDHGFSFSLKCWIDPSGIKYILGGHQRIKVIKKLYKTCTVVDYVQLEEGLKEVNRTN